MEWIGILKNGFGLLYFTVSLWIGGEINTELCNINMQRESQMCVGRESVSTSITRLCVNLSLESLCDWSIYVKRYIISTAKRIKTTQWKKYNLIYNNN